MKKLQKRENALQTVEQFYVPCDCYCDCVCHTGTEEVRADMQSYAPNAIERNGTRSILN